MSHEDDDQQHITRRELDDLKNYLDLKFKSQFNKTLLVIGVAVGFIKVENPQQAVALIASIGAVKIASLVLFRS